MPYLEANGDLADIKHVEILQDPQLLLRLSPPRYLHGDPSAQWGGRGLWVGGGPARFPTSRAQCSQRWRVLGFSGPPPHPNCGEKRGLSSSPPPPHPTTAVTGDTPHPSRYRPPPPGEQPGSVRERAAGAAGGGGCGQGNGGVGGVQGTRWGAGTELGAGRGRGGRGAGGGAGRGAVGGCREGGGWGHDGVQGLGWGEGTRRGTGGQGAGTGEGVQGWGTGTVRGTGTRCGERGAERCAGCWPGRGWGGGWQDGVRLRDKGRWGQGTRSAGVGTGSGAPGGARGYGEPGPARDEDGRRIGLRERDTGTGPERGGLGGGGVRGV